MQSRVSHNEDCLHSQWSEWAWASLIKLDVLSMVCMHIKMFWTVWSKFGAINCFLYDSSRHPAKQRISSSHHCDFYWGKCWHRRRFYFSLDIIMKFQEWCYIMQFYQKEPTSHPSIYSRSWSLSQRSQGKRQDTLWKGHQSITGLGQRDRQPSMLTFTPLATPNMWRHNKTTRNQELWQ